MFHVTNAMLKPWLAFKFIASRMKSIDYDKVEEAYKAVDDFTSYVSF